MFVSFVQKKMEYTFFGTHDSFTFLPPRSFWGWFAIPFFKTQNKTLDEQLENGYTCVDMRVTFEEGKPVFAHGIVKLKSEESFVDYLHSIEDSREWNLENDPDSRMYVRVILEDTKVKEENEAWFSDFCAWLESYFPNIIFFGGNRRCDWKQVYSFKNSPTLAQMVGSMADDARWYEKLIPWFYAKRMNGKNMEKSYKEDIVIFDFV